MVRSPAGLVCRPPPRCRGAGVRGHLVVALSSHIGYERAADLGFDVGGRSFGVFTRDWRTAPLNEERADLLLHGNSHPRADHEVVPKAGLPPGRADLDPAVKKGRRDLRGPDLLAHTPQAGEGVAEPQTGTPKHESSNAPDHGIDWNADNTFEQFR